MTQTDSLSQPPAENALEKISFLNLSPRESRDLEQLKVFMNRHDSLVGRVLRGQEEGRWAAKDMRRLESTMLKEIDDPKVISKMLRILRKIVSAWAMRHVPVAFPRIPVLPHYAKNPISPNLAHLLSRYREWRNWLDQWLETSGTANPDRYHPISTAVPVIASAVIYGGLLSVAPVVALVRTLSDVLGNASASKQKFYLDLRLSLPRTSETEYRAWEPDSVTACLLLRTDPAAVQDLLAPPDSTLADCGPSDSIVAARLRKLFKDTLANHRARNSKVPMGGIHGLIEAARMVAYLELPPILACYASRGLVSHSVPMRVLRRITRQDWYENPFHGASHQMPQVFERHTKKNTVVKQQDEFASDWLEPLRHKMLSKNPREFTSRLSMLASDSTQSPLVRQLAKFAGALLRQRNKADKPRPLNAIRNTVLEVATSIGPFLADGSDPAELSGEDLEQLYEQALASKAGFESAISRKARVIGSLREFDAYLRVWNGKAARDCSVLAETIEVLGTVDANFIAPTEYDAVLDRINRDLSLRQNPTRLKIVRLLVILGYRCGLRRLEALHLKVRDVLFEGTGNSLQGPSELLVRPSESHRLKSNNAKRRLPLDILLSVDEVKELKDWYAKRTSQSGVRSCDYLFGNSDGLDDFDVLPQTIFETINGFLQEVTYTRGDERPAHFHHLRHGFCTFGMLRLMTSDMVHPSDYLPGCEGLTAFLQSDGIFDPAKLHRHHLLFPTRKHAYLMSGLMGHGSPGSSMTYTHCLSWLLHASLAHSSTMSPAEETLNMAIGISAETRERRSRRASGDQIWRHLWDWRIRREATTVRQVDPEVGNSGVRSEDLPDWIEPIERFLREMDLPGQSVAGAARLCGVEESIAAGWWGKADYLRTLTSGIGTLRHRFEGVKSRPSSPDGEAAGHSPVRPLHATEGEIIARYGPLLQQLDANPSTRHLLKAGLSAYVQAAWFTKDFALFHHPDTEGPCARNFLDLLLGLKLQLRDIGLLRSKNVSNAGWSRRWRESLGLSKYITFEKGIPQAPASWLAIEPRFLFRHDPAVMSAGLAGFRYLMVMGYIAFGTLPSA